MCLISGSGRSPGEENGNPLQYSCLGNPVGREAWRAIVHGVAEESNTTLRLHNNILHLQLVSVWTSHISSAQQSTTADGYHTEKFVSRQFIHWANISWELLYACVHAIRHTKRGPPLVKFTFLGKKQQISKYTHN